MSEPVVPIQEPIIDQKEYNFAQLRKQMEYERAGREEERAARIEAEERAAKYERMAQHKPAEEDYDSEPYVDNKKLKMVMSNFEADIDKKIDAAAEKKAFTMIQKERDAQFLKANKDFEQVMNSDLVQKFADMNPDLAESILAMPKNLDREKLVYRYIKAMKIDQPEIKKPNIQAQINTNRTNPGFQPNGVAGAPYESVADFSPQGQKNAYERTQALIRGMKR